MMGDPLTQDSRGALPQAHQPVTRIREVLRHAQATAAIPRSKGRARRAPDADQRYALCRFDPLNEGAVVECCFFPVASYDHFEGITHFE